MTGSTVAPTGGTISSSGNPTASTDSPFDDPAGFVFGDAGDQNVIKCGSWTQGSGVFTAYLGWEPQWIMTKKVCENSGSTKLLFLQSSTDPLAFTATPGTISYTGSAMSASSDSPFASSGSVTFTGNQSNNIKIPVSYTHLTLPTIYSV